MTSDSRAKFEQWAKREGIDCSTQDGDHLFWLTVAKLWQGWSARDSEVERLREALKQCFDFPADVFDIPDNEPFTLTVTGKHLRAVREALSSQVKESGK